MIAIGRTVTGSFVKTTTFQGWQDDSLHHTNLSGAIFCIGDGVQAKLPIDHAVIRYSDGMTRRSLVELKPGTKREFEIIDIHTNGSYTVSEQVLLARQLLSDPPKVYEVTVTMPERRIGNGVQVRFPSGVRLNLRSRAIKGGHERATKLQSRDRLLVMCHSIDVHNAKWLMNMREVDANEYPELNVIRGGTMTCDLAAVLSEIAEADPDRADDIVREFAAGIHDLLSGSHASGSDTASATN